MEVKDFPTLDLYQKRPNKIKTKEVTTKNGERPEAKVRKWNCRRGTYWLYEIISPFHYIRTFKNKNFIPLR